MKPLTIVSSLFFITFLTYAYLPEQDIIHNPKAIDWHIGQHAYFAKIDTHKSLSTHTKTLSQAKIRKVV